MLVLSDDIEEGPDNIRSIRFSTLVLMGATAAISTLHDPGRLTAAHCDKIDGLGNLRGCPPEQRMLSKGEVRLKKVDIEKKVRCAEHLVFSVARLLFENLFDVLFVVGAERGPITDMIDRLTFEDDA